MHESSQIEFGTCLPWRSIHTPRSVVFVVVVARPDQIRTHNGHFGSWKVTMLEGVEQKREMPNKGNETSSINLQYYYYSKDYIITSTAILRSLSPPARRVNKSPEEMGRAAARARLASQYSSHAQTLPPRKIAFS